MELDLLNELQELDIVLTSKGDDLKIQAPKGALTETLLAKIKENKQDLIRLIANHVPIPATPPATSYVTTPAQKRMWLLSRFEGGNTAYNMSSALALKGTLEIDVLERAFHQLIAKHEILRTNFSMDAAEEVVQTITDTDSIEFSIVQKEVTHHSEAQLSEEVAMAESTTFDLSNGLLLHTSILTKSAEEHILIVTLHHIICDGWSSELLVAEVMQHYNQLLEDATYTPTPLRIQYKDYAAWADTFALSESYKASDAYWRSQFETQIPVLDLPSDYVRPAVKTFNGNLVEQHCSSTLLAALKDYSQSKDVTLFTTLFAGLNALLFTYTQQDDFVIGTPVAGREHPDLENQIGLYINTLAIRTQVPAGMTFNALVAHQKETLVAAYAHQSYPFENLITQLNLTKDVSRSPLFDVMIVLQNQSQLQNLATTDTLTGVEITPYEAATRSIAKFDLTFSCTETDTGLSLSVEYNTDIYTQAFITQLTDHYQSLLGWLVANPTAPITQASLLSDAETTQLLHSFNATEVSYPRTENIVALLADQVAQNPDAIAIRGNGVSLTYKAFEEQVYQFANFLQSEYQIGTHSIVGVSLPKSQEALITIFGILAVGAAYVPIDPAYPEDRKEWIIEDSGCKTIITSAVCKQFTERQETYATACIQPAITPSALAYIMYTSGTTGVPKGVMVTQKNIISLVKSGDFLALDQKLTLLSTGSISFDAVTIEFFGTLLNGATLVLMPQQDLVDTSKLKECLQQEEVQSLWMTAPWYKQVVEEDHTVFESLTQLMVGGDVVPVAQTRKLQRAYPSLRIINGYGPTENTTFSTTYTLEDKEYPTSIPIGKPIPNSHAYVLNEALALCPVGVVGELYVGGDGVAKGYVNAPELTSQRFIQDPFRAGNTLYKTGDLARWLSDGTIEYIGRNDTQIKLRGYRIELAEITKNIEQLVPAIQQAVVDVQEKDGDKSLVCYYITQAAITASEIKTLLKQALPHYMIPSYYKQLDTIPLNHNGKVAADLLPAISREDLAVTAFVAANTPTEKKLLELWLALFQLDRVSTTDNFFELGGNSLLMTKLTSQIRNTLDKAVDFNILFSYPTIQSLATYLDQLGQQEMELISSDALSFTQMRIWILDKVQNDISYNIFFKSSSPRKLNRAHTNEVINRLIDKHRSLRSYVIDADHYNPRVRYSTDSYTPVYKENVSISEEESNLLHKRYDMSQWPLFDVIVVENETTTILFNVHHIIIDGFSLQLLAEEFRNLYIEVSKGITKAYNAVSESLSYDKYITYQRTALLDNPQKTQLLLDYYSQGVFATKPSGCGTTEASSCSSEATSSCDSSEASSSCSTTTTDSCSSETTSSCDSTESTTSCSTTVTDSCSSEATSSCDSSETSSSCSDTAQAEESTCTPACQADYKIIRQRLPHELIHRLQALSKAYKCSMFTTLYFFYAYAVYKKFNQPQSIVAYPSSSRSIHFEKTIGLFANTSIMGIDFTEDTVPVATQFREFIHDYNLFSSCQGYPLEFIFSKLNKKYPKIEFFINHIQYKTAVSTVQAAAYALTPTVDEAPDKPKFSFHAYISEYSNNEIFIDNYFNTDRFCEEDMKALYTSFFEEFITTLV